ncbi:GNAT family N-acetyltransferase [Cytobacillus firmus]|uniref:GNAT family N-acetyltransferase n=1 Tax=Cytobacillus firmus TaxID=1399 RepID=UPI0018CFA619|nr:GNAT family N-acetyltransferase [Cytobacillus firmus]MBG9588369.1 acetyltransferase [Cytobacillus firmus]
MKVELAELNQYDIPGLIDLSASVGWDYDEYEVRTLLESGRVFGHKNSEGRIVSSSAIIPYDTKVASIGMVIVHEEFRGLGLAMEAVRKCAESINGDLSLMLIATKEGKPLYEKVGFKTVDFISKFLCDQFVPVHSQDHDGVFIEDFNQSDFAKLVNLDGAAFGDKRSVFLRNRISQSKQCLVVKNNNGEIIGYGLSIQGPVNLILGPIAAADSDTAAIIAEKLALHHEGKLRIDVPEGRKDFMSYLERSGFVKTNTPPVMMKNSAAMPQRNNNLYAIASQAFG